MTRGCEYSKVNPSDRFSNQHKTCSLRQKTSRTCCKNTAGCAKKKFVLFSLGKITVIAGWREFLGNRFVFYLNLSSIYFFSPGLEYRIFMILLKSEHGCHAQNTTKVLVSRLQQVCNIFWCMPHILRWFENQSDKLTSTCSTWNCIRVKLSVPCCWLPEQRR